MESLGVSEAHNMGNVWNGVASPLPSPRKKSVQQGQTDFYSLF